MRILGIVALLFVLSNSTAQRLRLDTDFGKNGIVKIKKGNLNTKIFYDPSDNFIYLTYSESTRAQFSSAFKYNVDGVYKINVETGKLVKGFGKKGHSSHKKISNQQAFADWSSSRDAIICRSNVKKNYIIFKKENGDQIEIPNTIKNQIGRHSITVEFDSSESHMLILKNRVITDAVFSLVDKSPSLHWQGMDGGDYGTLDISPYLDPNGLLEEISIVDLPEDEYGFILKEFRKDLEKQFSYKILSKKTQCIKDLGNYDIDFDPVNWKPNQIGFIRVAKDSLFYKRNIVDTLGMISKIKLPDNLVNRNPHHPINVIDEIDNILYAFIDNSILELNLNSGEVNQIPFGHLVPSQYHRGMVHVGERRFIIYGLALSKKQKLTYLSKVILE